MKLILFSCLIVLLCFFGFPGNLVAQVDLGSPTSKTPYDPYLGPMYSVLRQLNGPKADLGTAAALVREGRGFRYAYNKEQPYVPQTPEQTESTKAGDCKAKSLWLASKLNDRGVRFVIGKAKQVQNVSHAWLIWNGPEGWMILDATLYSSPLSPARLSRTDFVPTYSYGPGGKFSHSVGVGGVAAKNGDHL